MSTRKQLVAKGWGCNECQRLGMFCSAHAPKPGRFVPPDKAWDDGDLPSSAFLAGHVEPSAPTHNSLMEVIAASHVGFPSASPPETPAPDTLCAECGTPERSSRHHMTDGSRPNGQYLHTFVAPPETTAPTAPTDRLSQAAWMLRTSAGDEQRRTGQWTTQLQARIDCAIALEQMAVSQQEIERLRVALIAIRDGHSGDQWIALTVAAALTVEAI